MTQGRPPRDDVAGEDQGLPPRHPGQRSQTLPIGARPAQPDSAHPARGAFHQPHHPPRGAFPSNAGAFAADQDKTVKRPYPTSAGHTLPLGSEQPSASDREDTVVAPSAFPRTQAMAAAGGPPGSRSGGSGSAGDGDGELEPLRVPSQRPAPAPFQQARSSAAKTILMPGSPPAPAPAAAERAVHEATTERPPAQPARANAAAHKKTLPIGSVVAPEVAPAQPPAPAGSARPQAVQAPAPKRTAGIGSEKPVAQGAPAHNVSEPLQLQLDARDVLPHAGPPGRRPEASGSGPLIAGAAVVLLVAGALAGWLMSRDKPASSAEPAPIRGEGVIANDAPAQPATAPQAAPAAAAPAAAAPAVPAAAPAAAAAPVAQPPAAEPPAKSEPAVAKPAPAREQPKASAPAQKPKARPAARDRAPAAQTPAGVREARDALRGLDSDPVLQIKPKPSADAPEYDIPEPGPSLPDLPEPPPAPEE